MTNFLLLLALVRAYLFQPKNESEKITKKTEILFRFPADLSFRISSTTFFLRNFLLVAILSFFVSALLGTQSHNKCEFPNENSRTLISGIEGTIHAFEQHSSPRLMKCTSSLFFSITFIIIKEIKSKEIKSSGE